MFRKPLLFISFVLLFLSYHNNSFSQVKLSLSDGLQNNSLNAFQTSGKFSYQKTLKKYPAVNPAITKSQSDLGSILLTAALLPNPMVLYDDKKVYFGITKQVSVLLFAVRDFGVGRLGFEYSFIVNKDYPNHFIHSGCCSFYK
jgi:hypothetical protein